MDQLAFALILVRLLHLLSNAPPAASRPVQHVAALRRNVHIAVDWAADSARLWLRRACACKFKGHTANFSPRDTAIVTPSATAYGSVARRVAFHLEDGDASDERAQSRIANFARSTRHALIRVFACQHPESCERPDRGEVRLRKGTPRRAPPTSLGGITRPTDPSTTPSAPPAHANSLPLPRDSPQTVEHRRHRTQGSRYAYIRAIRNFGTRRSSTMMNGEYTTYRQ